MLGEGGEGPADLANYDHEAPVLHVLVVGFHHKKGCQVIKKNLRGSCFSKHFFSRLNSHTHHLFLGVRPYLPRLMNQANLNALLNISHLKVPSQWRNLPSLALPDGSHNWSDDTVYFHLPALHDPRKTVFGISCYRQVGSFFLFMFLFNVQALDIS